jgi:hypothetical protein
MSSGGSGVNTSSTSQDITAAKAPYGPTTGGLQSLIDLLGGQIGQIGNANEGTAGNLSAPESLYGQAAGDAASLPNFGPAASNTAADFLQTGGDPTGLLRTSAGNLQSVAGEGANGGAGLNPMDTPGMQGVLNTIQQDVSNQVNSQFAGAGRSLSGLNEQTLARGLAQGEAVPLLNQYNQNVSNMESANQGLGSISQSAAGNIGSGLNYAAAAPGLASINPLTAAGALSQQTQLPYTYIQQAENLLNPIAGLGGTSNSQQQGTATGSLLSALTGILGGGANSITSGLSGLLSSIF